MEGEDAKPDVSKLEGMEVWLNENLEDVASGLDVTMLENINNGFDVNEVIDTDNGLYDRDSWSDAPELGYIDTISEATVLVNIDCRPNLKEWEDTELLLDSSTLEDTETGVRKLEVSNATLGVIPLKDTEAVLLVAVFRNVDSGQETEEL